MNLLGDEINDRVLSKAYWAIDVSIINLVSIVAKYLSKCQHYQITYITEIPDRQSSRVNACEKKPLENSL